MGNARYDFLLGLAEEQRQLMFDAERHIWANPETGYREWETQKYLAGQFEKLGYELKMAGNIPGFSTDIDTGRKGPRLLIMGELDSLIVSSHPECNRATGAVHACGHHAQAAALLGLAAALKRPGALDGLCGSIRLMAVPAEELIEIAFREKLREDGIIKYFGGKVEMMRRGFMDGCDIAVMVHTGDVEKGFSIVDGGNGCVAKSIEYTGVSSHAGGAPDKGINALYAATLGMQAVNSLRETFIDEEHVRFHPIITRGGGVVNAIPHDVAMESYVRGATLEAILGNNRKINRALAASAAAIGANVMLRDRPGYMPLANDRTFAELTVAAVTEALGDGWITYGGWMSGCTDMGDISQVMPALHPVCGGAAGTGHGMDYRIANPEAALVESCKLQLIITEALLGGDANGARRVIDGFKPRFKTYGEFFAEIDSIFLDKQAVIYGDDGRVTLDFTSGAK